MLSNKMNKTRKSVEPFAIGVDRYIKNKKEAIEVINKNLYYMYVASGLFFILFIVALYRAYISSGYPNPMALIIGGIYFSLIYFIRKYKSIVSSYILLTLNLILLAYILYLYTKTQSLGIEFLFTAILVTSSLRIIEAIKIYKNLTKKDKI